MDVSAEVLKMREASLLAEHARLMNEGYPAEETETFRERVASLPEGCRARLMESIELSRALKVALLPPIRGT